MTAIFNPRTGEFRQTHEKAALHQTEGYLEARQRSGYFVLFRSSDGFAASPPPPTAAAVSDPSVAENGSETAFPFSVLAQTMRRVLTRYGKTILEKSPNAGIPPLRDALCRYLARNRGIFTDRRRLIIGSGAEYLYSLIALMLGERRLFAIESPSYEKIEQVYRNAGVRCDLLPLGHDGIDSRALAATAAKVMTKASLPIVPRLSMILSSAPTVMPNRNNNNRMAAFINRGTPFQLLSRNK